MGLKPSAGMPSAAIQLRGGALGDYVPAAGALSTPLLAVPSGTTSSSPPVKDGLSFWGTSHGSRTCGVPRAFESEHKKA